MFASSSAIAPSGRGLRDTPALPLACEESPMPRYFFHVADGADFPDNEGTVLANVSMARAQAIETAGAMLRDRGALLSEGTEWRMTVVDNSGNTVCLLRF